MFSKRNAWMVMVGGFSLSVAVMISPPLWAQAPEKDKTETPETPKKDKKDSDSDPFKKEEERLAKAKAALLRWTTEGESLFSHELIQALLDQVGMGETILQGRRTLANLSARIIEETTRVGELRRLSDTAVDSKGAPVSSFDMSRNKVRYERETLKLARDKALYDQLLKKIALDERLEELQQQRIALLQVRNNLSNAKKELALLKQLEEPGANPTAIAPHHDRKTDKRGKVISKEKEAEINLVMGTKQGVRSFTGDAVEPEYVKNAVKRKARIGDLQTRIPQLEQSEKDALQSFRIWMKEDEKKPEEADQERLIAEFIANATKPQNEAYQAEGFKVAQAEANFHEADVGFVAAMGRIDEAERREQNIREDNDRKAKQVGIVTKPDGTWSRWSLGIGATYIGAHRVTNGVNAIVINPGVYIHWLEYKPKFTNPPPGGITSSSYIPKKFYFRSGIEALLGADINLGGAISGGFLFSPIELRFPVLGWLSVGGRLLGGYYGVSEGANKTTTGTVTTSVKVPGRNYGAVGGVVGATFYINPQAIVYVGLGALGLLKPDESGAAFMLTFGFEHLLPNLTSSLVKSSAADPVQK